MADPLDNVNEVLEELKGASLQTSAGTFVRMEHVERLLKKRAEARDAAAIERVEEPPPKTLAEARSRAARDLREAMPRTSFPEPGKAVRASQ